MPVEIRADCFDPWVIMESGQCFRMVALDGGRAVETVAFGQQVVITSPEKGRYVFDCDQEMFDRLWRGYFDLETDYPAIIAAAPKEDAFLARAIQRSRGMRILRQEPWETLCGFILSQRKNLKAIRTCVEALCNAFGEPVAGTSRKSFPTPQRLADASHTEAYVCGLGYRTPYLLDAARKVASGALNLAAMASLPDDVLLDMLMSVSGVGIKVADCVMLFAYRRLSRAPVDVWIRRVIDDVYGGVAPFAGYGPYAGIYQQYMFMLIRDAGRRELVFDELSACEPATVVKRSKR